MTSSDLGTWFDNAQVSGAQKKSISYHFTVDDLRQDGVEGVSQVLLANQFDVGLHGLGGYGVPPEGQMLILHWWNLIHNNVGQDILSHVLRMENVHQGRGELLLHFHTDVRLKKPEIWKKYRIYKQVKLTCNLHPLSLQC